MNKEINTQISYVKNLLRSLSYLSIQSLRSLELILSKLLRLDVMLDRLRLHFGHDAFFLQGHASRQDIIREEKANVEAELVFSLEQLDTNDHNTTAMKHDQADKLDCLMFVMFEYINSVCISHGQSPLARDRSEHVRSCRNSELRTDEVIIPRPAQRLQQNLASDTRLVARAVSAFLHL